MRSPDQHGRSAPGSDRITLVERIHQTRQTILAKATANPILRLQIPSTLKVSPMTNPTPKRSHFPQALASVLLRLLKSLFGAALALLILFEEWGWEPLQRALAWVGRLPGWRWIEARITALPPYGALALFLLPTLMLLPVKLLALWLIAHGQVLAGTLVIIIAKLAGTAVVARLFSLTKPTLMQLAWFGKLYGRWTVWKTVLLAQVRASCAWQFARVVKHRMKQRWQHVRAKWNSQP